MDTERTPTQAQDVSELTDADWRERLDPDAYQVLRHAATERPFTGAFTDNKDDGMYHCAGCGVPLFSSDTKFDSGCGWPSFFEPVTGENVISRADTTHGMTRTSRPACATASTRSHWASIPRSNRVCGGWFR
jgi:peptide-methionine (R)-S-oxide reductase